MPVFRQIDRKLIASSRKLPRGSSWRYRQWSRDTSSGATLEPLPFDYPGDPKKRPVRFVQKVVSNRSSRPVGGPAEESIDVLFEAIGRFGRTTYPFSQVILRRFRRFSNNSIHLPSVGSGWRVARIGREVLQRGTERASEAGGEMVCKRRRSKGDGQSIERRG